MTIIMRMRKRIWKNEEEEEEEKKLKTTKDDLMDICCFWLFQNILLQL